LHLDDGRMLTRVSLPVKVVLGIAVALEISSDLVACRAVGEGDVVVSDVVEEVDLFLVEHDTGGDGVDGGVTPTLVEKATILVEGLEEVGVGLGAKPVQVTDFEVGPLRLVSK